MGDDLKVEWGAASASRQYRNISKIVVHEGYSISNNIPKNDIALIILAEPFVPTNTFSPVDVTSDKFVDNESCRIGKKKKSHHIQCFHVNRFVFTAGWGLTGGGYLSEDLMALTVSVLPTKICKVTAVNTICAGSTDSGRGVCPVRRLVKF